MHPWKWHESRSDNCLGLYSNNLFSILFHSAKEKSRKKMKKLLMKSLFRASLLFVYALFGGSLFYCIEKKPEDNKDVYLRLSRELQTNFINKFNVSNDFKSFIHRAFEVIQKLIFQHIRYRVTTNGKTSAQPHTIVKQICFLNGNVFFCHCFLYPRTECIM